MTVRRTGVCSWSLRPADTDSLVDAVRQTGVTAMQIALDPIRTGAMPLARLQARLAETGISLLSGMMGMEGEDYSTLESIRETGGVLPDGTWAANRKAALENARIARELGLELVTFHAGFAPESAEDPRRETVIERVLEIGAIFGEHGIGIALETGQETADTLLERLVRLDGTGINFDPANMILYGTGDPVAALERLAPHVVQVHIKDAIASPVPGQWGREVPAGEGDVDWAAFFAVLQRSVSPIDTVIERESGQRRIEDVRQAVSLIRRHTGVADG